MQKEYGSLVKEYTKKGLHINKTNFSLLLKAVRDKVLTPANIVKSFQTCGYYPFSFEASYTNRKVPPTSNPSSEDDDDDDDETEWEDILDVATNDYNTTMQSPPTTPPTCSVFDQTEFMPLHQHPSYSSPQPQRLQPRPI